MCRIHFPMTDTAKPLTVGKRVAEPLMFGTWHKQCKLRCLVQGLQQIGFSGSNLILVLLDIL